MEILVAVLILICIVLLILLLIQKSKAKKTAAILKEKEAYCQSLSKYEPLADVDAVIKDRIEAVKRTEREAKDALSQAIAKRDQIITQATEQSNTIANEAIAKRDQIIAEANAQANAIAGEAIALRDQSAQLAKTVTAMRNTINGYGDEYIIPTYSLLDDLAEEFGYDEAGQKLKEAREHTRKLVKAGKAAVCDYVEATRRNTAVRFVTDAFNGKVDSILSKIKQDNYGVQKKKIEDAFALVNTNGAAFRNAVITQEYLDARLDELKWGCTAQALRQKKLEEQQELRERMREEEKARREFERALKDAAKEEEMLNKAMEKAKAALAAASEAQRAKFEAQLDELSQKLQAAEERSQRAKSMAEQTKMGNVYIISNIGSFGENVYKIGMTRRLEPLDRIRELGDASVPFGFDVHAMIESDDAPALETELHRVFMHAQMNKVNPRKEYFKVGINDIRQYVEAKGIKTFWTLEAAAAQYRETLAIEEQIRTNPQVREQWERNMMQLEASAQANDSDESIA